eukprot:CAMPEP_0198561670 /NCGR_PEP_ID=MMETSP1462-20131121/95851_1 /TAXON_ID=1333877 /ORGANISM="Brandtodinium nutriculum, Strain RCC3387" /LENGTH=41 /DNA_ID= /DNA_START= /DNA_END= /DNA_ORIENTATION=
MTSCVRLMELALPTVGKLELAQLDSDLCWPMAEPSLSAATP